MSAEKLRVLGTSVTLLEEIRAAAKADLGFEIEFDILTGVEAQQKGVTKPQEFDIYDQWFNSIDLLWTAGAIQSIDTARIDLWDQVSDLTKKGKLLENSALGKGAKPVDLIYVQDEGTLGSNPTSRISMLPTAHNVDSFAYNKSIADQLQPGEEESWAWLFDERWHGNCGLLSDPAIGIADVAMAAQASGALTFDNIGNMSIEEIDRLIEILIEKKRSGHFSNFWATTVDSVNLVKRRKAQICSIWSPAFFELIADREPIVGAAPREGYRGWHSGLAISSAVSGRKLDAAYAYLNWWLSGKAGALVARQGYYMSVLETTKEHLSEDEWSFWYEGNPANNDLLDPHGNTIISRGAVRDGGSYWQRVSNIAVWSTLMDEHNYLVRRWNDFLLT